MSEINRLREALKYYADKPCVQEIDIGWDVGFIARKALSSSHREGAKTNCPKCNETLEETRNDDYWCRSCNKTYGMWGDGSLISPDREDGIQKVRDMLAALQELIDKNPSGEYKDSLRFEKRIIERTIFMLGITA